MPFISDVVASAGFNYEENTIHVFLDPIAYASEGSAAGVGAFLMPGQYTYRPQAVREVYQSLSLYHPDAIGDMSLIEFDEIIGSMVGSTGLPVYEVLALNVLGLIGDQGLDLRTEYITRDDLIDFIRGDLGEQSAHSFLYDPSDVDIDDQVLFEAFLGSLDGIDDPSFDPDFEFFWGEDHFNLSNVDVVGFLEKSNAVFPSGQIVTVSNGSDGFVSAIKSGAEAIIDGVTYVAQEAVEGLVLASEAISKFIQGQAGELSEWFSATNGAQVVFAQWLGENIEDLIAGDLDADEVFVSLAETLATEYTAYQLSEFLDGEVIEGKTAEFTAAHKMLAQVLHDVFKIDKAETDVMVTGFYTVIGRMAVDFAAHSSGWDSDDYVDAGIMAISAYLSQRAAEKIFGNFNIEKGIYVYSSPSAQSNAAGTVAAVSSIVSALLEDHQLNRQEYIQLGAAAGVAYGVGYSVDYVGTLIADRIIAAYQLTGIGAGIVSFGITTVLSLVSSKILSAIIGGKKYYPGEFASRADLIKSIYTTADVDDGNGGTVKALIATNAQGSTILLKAGYTYAIGGSGSDTLVGDGGGLPKDDMLVGGGGDDYLEGRAGNDNLIGEGAHDHIIGGEGDDIILGGDGNDELFGDEGDDIIMGDAGDDFIHGGSGDDAIQGGDGEDIILAGQGADVVDGGAGRDIIEAGGGDDFVSGGAGDDVIMGNIGNDNISGDAGNDQLFGEEGNDQISGGDGADFIDGGDGVDIISGDNGADILVGGLDDDALDGGLGNDSLHGGLGADLLIGGLDDDLLLGDLGDDDLQGGLGDDILWGDFGDDVLDGGEGDDKYFFLEGEGADEITDADGSDIITLGDVSSAEIDFEQDGDDLIIYYGAGADQITIKDHFIAGNEIEKLEVSDGYVDLTSITFPGGVPTYSVLADGAPSLAAINTKISSFNSYQERKAAELAANSLLGIIGEETYGEAMRDEVKNTYYNGSEIEVFKRKRGAFGGHYTIYKVLKDTTLEDDTAVFSLREIKPGDDTTGFDSIVNATKVVWNGWPNTIEDMWVDGKIVSTTLINQRTNVTTSLAAGRDVVDYSNGYSLLTAAARLAGGTVSSVSLGITEKAPGLDYLVGSYWAETLTGNGGDDYLFAGDGNDTVNGGTGNDWMFGGGGNDVMNGGPGDDLILGGVGNDVIYGGPGDDAIIGGDGDDVIYGEEGNDWIDGGNGNDVIVGSSGTDAINGQDDSDTVQYTDAPNAVVVNLQDGTVSGYGDDILINIEKVTASAYNDTIYGSVNANVIDGGAGADTMIGGDGNDYYYVDNAGDVVTEAASEGTDTVQSSITYTLTNNVENLTLLAGSSVIHAYGNALNNYLLGNGANNIMYGYDGNDTLNGAAGVDTMYGGAGDDVYYIGNSSDIASENYLEGTDTVYSVVSYVLPQYFENLILTGTTAINANGNIYSNIIDGSVNTAVNTLMGGGGDDTYIVGTGDVTVEYNGYGIDTVQTAITWALSSYIENLTLTGSANINGTGNGLDNVITGNAGNNTLNGGVGSDTIYGGAGNDFLATGSNLTPDTMYGGLGDDYYYANNAGDLHIENVNEGTDTVEAALSWTLSSNIENLLFNGTGNFTGHGNNLNNTITGNSGNNTLYGYDGDDVINGGAGSDVVYAGAGNDTIGTGSAATADTMYGGEGDDFYYANNAGDLHYEYANEGTDTIQVGMTWSFNTAQYDHFENMIMGGSSAINGTGNSLNNTLDGSVNTAVNTLTGLGGDDTYIVGTGDIVVEAAASGTDTVQSAATYTLTSNVENLVLTGTGNIDGYGNALDNTITGNAGNNWLSGSSGNDTMIGGDGDDIYIAIDAGDIAIENADEGTDTVRASLTFSIAAFANVENLVMTGSSAIDGTGNDMDNTLDGSVNTAVNTLTGGLGNDTYIVGTGDVVVENAAEGNDTIQSAANYTLGANIENLTLTGTATSGTGNDSNNTIIGNASVNILTGGLGNDVLDGGTGADTLIGGDGNDYYYVDNAGDVVTENAAEGTDTVQSAITYTLGSNVENLTLLPGYTVIHAYGNALDNYLIGNGANNLMYGYGGNDTLNGAAGADTMYGGTGDDIYYVGASTDVAVENASEGTDTVYSSITYTLASNLENLILTGTTAINATGNSLANIITGNSGVNTLDGGTGADTLIGGAGDDIYIVDNASDVITENAGEGVDSVRASLSWTLADNVENVTLTGSASINAYGNDLDNILLGNAGSNIMYGYDGNDTFGTYSGATADTMYGGLGDDLYHANNYNDLHVENANEGIDTINATLNWTLEANIENLVLLGTSNLEGYGNGLDNIIVGNTGNNWISGGYGDDTMIGGAGNDYYVVLDVGDVIIESVNEGIDGVQVYGVDYTLAANVENITLMSTDHIHATGNALNNSLTGNSGNNTLDGGFGNDVMAGGAGDDTYIVDSAGDTVTESASAGTDTVQSRINYTLGSNLENLVLLGTLATIATGNTLNNEITGNSIGNTLDGGTGADAMAGGDGDDVYIVDNAGDTVTEDVNEGTDLVQSSVTLSLSANVENLTLTGAGNINGEGNSLDNIITGNTGNNTLYGYDGDDTINGGAGADVVYAGAGNDTIGTGSALTADTMYGGDGDDYYYANNAGDLHYENVGEGNDTIQASLSWTLAANIESLILGGTSNINATGNSLNNIITGNSGNNTIDGGAGIDSMTGGAGNDVYIVDHESDKIYENSGEGTDSVYSSVFHWMWSNTENLYLTGSANIDGWGNGSANTIVGNSGNNLLMGRNGNDVLDGGAGTDTASYSAAGSAVIVNLATGTATGGDGNDTLSNIEDIIGSAYNDTLAGNSGSNTIMGGAGNDTMDGGSGTDTVSYALATSSISVSFLTGTATGEGTDTLSNFENIIGSDYNDTLIGSTGNNSLIGGAGNDTLNGAAGIDAAYGGTGDDYYVIGNSSDTVFENADEGIDTVEYGFGDYTLGANVENLKFTGGSDYHLTGNSLSNILTGNSGNNIFSGGAGDDTEYGMGGADTLQGGTGNDTLYGGDGLDTLWGGDDADVFVFEATSAFNNVDVIKDFTTGQGDAIDLRDLLTGYDPMTDAITDFVEITTSGSDSILKVDMDGTGGVYSLTQIATIEGVTGLTDEAALSTAGNLTVT